MHKTQNGNSDANKSPVITQDPSALLNLAFAENDEDKTKDVEQSNEPTTQETENNDVEETDVEQPAETQDDDEQKEMQNAAEKNEFERSAHGLHKRIGKLTAKNKAQLEEIETLKSRISELEKSSKQENEKPTDEIEALNSLEDVDKYADNARKERATAFKMLSSDDDEFVVNGTTYSRGKIAEYIENLNTILDLKLPARKRAIKAVETSKQMRSKYEQQAKDTFDWYADSTTAGSQWVKEQLDDPNLTAKLPMLLGYAYKGLEVLNVQNKFADKRAVKTAPTKPVAPQSEPVKTKAGFFRADGSFDQDLAKKHLWD